MSQQTFVCWTVFTSVNKLFQAYPAAFGSVKTFSHCSLIQCFIWCSSRQTLLRRFVVTWLSHLCLCSCLVYFPMFSSLLLGAFPCARQKPVAHKSSSELLASFILLSSSEFYKFACTVFSFLSQSIKWRKRQDKIGIFLYCSLKIGN